MIFYDYYLELNSLLSSNILQGIDLFLHSLSNDTRNHVFALILRPVYLLFHSSHKAYIWGIFVFFFIPAMYMIIKFLQKQIVEKDDDKFLKFYISFMVLSTPIFWYITIIGYPDIFSLGIFCYAIILFFKYPFTQKVSFKNLLLFTFLLYFSVIFRRWFLIAIESFVISYIISFVLNCIIKKISYSQFKTKILYIIKNFLIVGCLFLILIAVLNNQVFKDLLDPNFRDLFDGYKVPLYENFDIVESHFNLPVLLMIIFILYSNISKNLEFILFSLINAIVYFFVFASIEVLCTNHIMIFCFWLMCFYISGIAEIYKSIQINILKKVLIIIVMFFFGINFFCLFTENYPEYIKPYIQNINFYTPYKPKNLDILQKIETEIIEKSKENPNYKYSIWAFENENFNQQLIFQEGNDKCRENMILPPIIDVETIVTGSFTDVVGLDIIYTTEPLQPYIYEKDNKILFYAWEMLKNREAFGTAFKRTDTGMKLNNGEKVIKYERIRPATKADYEHFILKIIEMYPFAKEYIREDVKILLESP